MENEDDDYDGVYCDEGNGVQMAMPDPEEITSVESVTITTNVYYET